MPGRSLPGPPGARPTRRFEPPCAAPAATVGAYACFALGGAAVLYGLYLIIPQFH